MFKDFESEWRMFLIVAAIVLVLGGGGILLLKTMQAPAPMPQPTQQTPPPSRQPQATDTSDWQTYRNDKYGFEIEYPSDWFDVSWKEERASNVFILSNNSSGLSDSSETNTVELQIVVSTSGGEIFDKLKPLRQGEVLYDKPEGIIKLSDLTIVGHLALRVRYPQSIFRSLSLFGSEQVWVKKGQKAYMLGLFAKEEKYIEANLAFFDQILSTFRFIEEEKQSLNLPWGSVCQELGSPFLIEASSGDTLTHIGRKATQDYITSAIILNIGKKPPAFSQAQRIFAEDYIKDYLAAKGIVPTGHIEVACELVEIALMSSLDLTPAQRENLETYARSSFELDELRELLELIRGPLEGTDIQPYIIIP